LLFGCFAAPHGIVLDRDKRLAAAWSGDRTIGRRRNRETGIVGGLFNSNPKTEGERLMAMEVEDFEPNSMANFEYDLDDTGATFDFEEFKAMGVNPVKSTKAKPGTEEKVLMLSARYAAGLPLWHDRDCYDHGPKERELMGAISDAHPQPLPIPETDDEV
jgi:hypothetical protein